MLNVGRRRPGAEQVCLPLGDGSSRLGDPLHTDWIAVTSKIMQILETNSKQPIDSDLMCHFAANAAFTKARGAPSNQDMSISLVLKFKQILRKLFHNGLISVQPASHQTQTNCDWASMFFVLGQRSIGLHFLSEQPYFEVFYEATGEAFTTETLAAALAKSRKDIAAEVIVQTMKTGNSATNASTTTAIEAQMEVDESTPRLPKRPADLALPPTTPAQRFGSGQYLPPWLAGGGGSGGASSSGTPVRAQQQPNNRPILQATPEQDVRVNQTTAGGPVQRRFHSGMF